MKAIIRNPVLHLPVLALSKCINFQFFLNSSCLQELNVFITISFFSSMYFKTQRVILSHLWIEKLWSTCVLMKMRKISENFSTISRQAYSNIFHRAWRQCIWFFRFYINWPRFKALRTRRVTYRLISLIWSTSGSVFNIVWRISPSN